MSSRTERTAEQAWDYLSSAMSTAGETATKAASKAGGKGHDLADEAWQRANAAAAALAGRKPGRPWGVIALTGRAGLAVGWLVASYARTALARASAEEEQELAETAVIVTGSDR